MNHPYYEDIYVDVVDGSVDGDSLKHIYTVVVHLSEGAEFNMSDWAEKVGRHPWALLQDWMEDGIAKGMTSPYNRL